MWQRGGLEGHKREELKPRKDTGVGELGRREGHTNDELDGGKDTRGRSKS